MTMADPAKAGLSTDECFVLDVLRKLGCSNFSGPPFDSMEAIVRQLGESQPSVKHAAMALTGTGTSFAEAYFDDGRGNTKKLNHFVLRQTSKSLTSLLRQPTPEGLSNGRAHREVVMTMCVVLALLANFQQDLATCKMHLMYGRRAMQEWRDMDFDGSSIAPILSAVLAHLDCTLQIGSNPAWFVQDDNPFLLHASGTSSFNMSTAESTVNRHWSSWSGTLLPEVHNFFWSRCGCPDYILKSSTIGFLFKVRIYTRQLKTCIEEVGLSAPQSMLDLLSLLKLWEQVTCTFVTAALADDGDASFKPLHMRYDAFLVYFRRINEMTKKILNTQIRRKVSIPAFPIGDAVGTPLFLCGYCCRDWSTRREALHLLEAWDARFKGLDVTGFLPAKISALERIIDIESHGLQPGSVVPESARINFVQFIGNPGSLNIRDFSYRLLWRRMVIKSIYPSSIVPLSPNQGQLSARWNAFPMFHDIHCCTYLASIASIAI